MDERFHRIYRDLNELYRATQAWAALGPPMARGAFRQDVALGALGTVSEAVESAAAALGDQRSLRADGRLFLVTNLHQMVALPLSQPDSPVELTRDVEAGIKEDARTIIRAAAESAGDRSDIPASHVLWGTSRVLDRLNLKQWRIWERE